MPVPDNMAPSAAAQPHAGGEAVVQHGLLLDDIRISQQGAPLFSLSGHVAPGMVMSVMGESGSGKSTLLSYIGGFLDPHFTGSGRVVLNGRDIAALPTNQRRIGVLFQDALLFPHLSVLDNLLFALPAKVRGKADRLDKAEVALEKAGLAGFGPRDPATLSGGQKARVALMRVLLSEPEALLLDEPFSALDAGRREQVRTFVFEHIAEAGLPALMVTHDLADARAANGPLVRLGPPQ